MGGTESRYNLWGRASIGLVAVISLISTGAVTQPAVASSGRGENVAVSASATATSDAIASIDQAAAAKQEASWTERFNLIVDQLRQDLPEAFAGSLVDPSQTSGHVWFVGDVPEHADSYFESIDSVSIAGGASVSETAVYQTAVDVMDQLVEATGGTVPLVTYPVPTQEKVVVEFSSTDGSVIESAVSGTSRRSIAGAIEIDLKPSDNFTAADPELFHGARPLAGVCTGAFPVRRKGGNELGILTAAHCPGTGSYDGTSNAFFAPYAYSISTASGQGGGDFRWNHSRYGLSGLTFVAGNQSMRVFNSHAAPSVGSGVCGYGKETDYKCETVAECGLSATTVVPDNNQTYTVGGLCRVRAHVTTGGDSGGPWFIGNTAYGIHYGRVGSGSAFSLVSNALIATRVNLVVDGAGNTVP